MSISLVRRLSLWSGAFAAALAFCSIAVHPSGAVKRVAAPYGTASYFKPSPEIGSLLKRSCMDCHSNTTIWPWYSYVAPLSWLVERDVRSGRDRMNFSEWERRSVTQREQMLADIATVVKNHEMPLRQYTLVHREAKLSENETDLLYTWARIERRRLRAASLILPVADPRLQESRNYLVRREYSAPRNSIAR